MSGTDAAAAGAAAATAFIFATTHVVASKVAVAATASPAGAPELRVHVDKTQVLVSLATGTVLSPLALPYRRTPHRTKDKSSENKCQRNM